MTSPHFGSRALLSHRTPPLRSTAAAVPLAFLLALTVLTALLTGVAGPVPAEAAAGRGSLSVSPAVAVGGQLVTFTGRMPRAGRQRIRLQFHMGRAQDAWSDVERGNVGSTRADGSFSFRFQAPAMFEIRYRVASAKGVTPATLFRSRWQDLELSGGRDVSVGETFALTVDTTPDTFQPPPAFVGRSVQLQQRVGGYRWATVGAAPSDAAGLARFRVTAPPAAGTVAYRAVSGDWTRGGSRIGWTPSYPYYVDVSASDGDRGDRRAIAAGTSGDHTGTESPRAPRPSGPPQTSAGKTAASRYAWGPTLFDFAWEFGESLTSKPFRGTRMRGRWLDASDGTGRVKHHNGGLAVQAGRDNRDATSHGTTAVTLQGNAQSRGRWEFLMRTKQLRAGPREHRVRIELVPEGTGARLTGGTAITVAELTANGRSVTVGASRGGHSWTWTKGGVRRGDDAFTFAVEVTGKHITWFLQGRPIASTTTSAAIPRGRLTPRISLVGVGQQQMSQSEAVVDWMRAWPLGRGKQVTGGHRL